MNIKIKRCLSLLFCLSLIFTGLAPMAPAYAEGDVQVEMIEPEAEEPPQPDTAPGIGEAEAPQEPDEPETIPVTGVELSVQSGTVAVGESVQLFADVYPYDATLATVSWSVTGGTGDGSIDGFGLFTGAAPGSVTVCACADDGNGAFGEYELTVIPAADAVSEEDPGEQAGGEGSVQVYDSVLLRRDGGNPPMYQVSAAVYTAFCECVRPELVAMAFDIDVSGLSISQDDFHDAYQRLLNEDLTLTNVGGDYSLTVADGIVRSVAPGYLLSAEEAQSEERRVQKAIRDILTECVSDDMSDMQKALAVHDYFCCHYEYAYDGGYGHNYAHMLLEGRGVCQAYADAYSRVMQAAGVTCYTVNSNSMTHSWNMIYIDGEWYHVDVTWDDRYNSYDDPALAYAQHRYFLLSDSAILSTDGGHYAVDNAPAAAGSAIYDDYFWHDLDSPISVTPDCYYYAQRTDADSSAIICRSAADPAAVQTVKTVAIAEPSCMGLAAHGGRLYYNSASQILSCLPDGTDERTEAAPNIAAGSFISRMYISGDTLYYGVGTDAYLPGAIGELALSAGRPMTALALPGTISVTEGNSGRFTAEISPADASVRALSWVSSAPEILSVDAAAGTYHALTVGTATVTATATDGSGVTASCTVNVNSSTPPSYTGSVTPSLRMTNLVVFVRFAGDTDEDFNAVGYKPKRTVWTELKERYDNAVTDLSDSTYYNDVDDSFCAYIREVSGGKVQVTNVFPQDYTQDGMAKVSYIDLSLTREQVGDDNEFVIGEVIDAFASGALTLPSGTVLDQRESGVLDNLTIVIQGASEEYVDSIMRSHKGVSGSSRKIGNKLVRNYNVLCGDALISSRASLITHEFMHSIGLPDLYRYAGNGDPVGVWDIMASEGAFLQYPLSYQRYAQGWIDLDEISESGDYYLTSPLRGGGNQGFIIRSPLNESELFVVEYREKNTNSSLRGFELKIPYDGVIVYRVNTTVENLTNAFGGDYIYVFRDGETGLTDSYSPDRLNTGAALAAGESRGSADLSAAFADRTIFYSDGTNSGIVISAEGVQSNGTMKIHVSYPDYSALGLWDKLGSGPASASAQDGCSLATDGAGNLYLAYIEPASSDDMLSSYGTVKVMKHNGSQWVSLGSPGQTDGQDVSLVCFDGDVFVGYQKRGAGAVAARYTSSWRGISCGAGVRDVRLACDGDDLYSVSLTDDGRTLYLAKLNAARTAFTALGTQSGASFSAPALAVFDGRAVVVCNDVLTAGSDTLVLAYDEAASGWVTLGALPTAHGLRAVSRNGKLWVLRTPMMSKDLYLSSYDGESWSDELSYSSADNFGDYAFDVYGGSPVLAVNPSYVCSVNTVSGGAFTQSGYSVRSDAQNLSLLLDGATAYIAVTGGDRTLSVYERQIAALSSNAHLSSLSVDGADLAPAFSPYTYSYTAEVPADREALTLDAAPSHPAASVEGLGTKQLSYGPNSFTVTVTAEDGFTQSSYEVTVTRRTIPATAVRLTPATASLLTGQSQTLTCSLTPANTTDTLSFTSSNSSVASVDPSTGEVRAHTPGKATIKAMASSGKYAQCVVTVSYLADRVTVESSTITPSAVAVIDNAAQTILLDQKDLLSVTGGYKLRLHAGVYDGNGDCVTSAVVWTSTDTAIGTVSTERATGDAVLTVKGAKCGIFRIRAVSTDSMKRESYVTVYVRDYAPRIGVASVMLNPWLSEGVSVDILPSYGNGVTGAELLVPVTVNRRTVYQPSAELSITRVDGTDTWVINNLNAEGDPVSIKNATIRGRVRISTEREEQGEPAEYELPLNIVIANRQPVISVRQSAKFNLFYTDETAELTVSAKDAAVTGVELSSTPTFAGGSSGGLLTVSYADPLLPSSGYVSGRPVTRGTLLVSLEGYNWPVPKVYTLSTVTTKPPYILSAANATVNTAVEAEPSVSFYLMDKASGDPVVLDAPAEIAKLSVSGFASLSPEGEGMRLALQQVNGKYVSGTATLSIKQSNWLTPIQYPFTVRVVSILPVARVSGTMELSSVFASVDRFASLPVVLDQKNTALKSDSIALSSTNAAAQAVLDVVYEGSSITAAFKPGVDPTTLKNGSYIFRFTPLLDTGAALKPVSVTVKISSGVPGVKVNTVIVNRLGYNLDDSAAPLPCGRTQLVVTDNRNALVAAAAAGGTQSALIDGAPMTLVTTETRQALRDQAEKLRVEYENGTVSAAVTDPDVKPGSYRFALPLRYSDGGTARGSKNLTVTVRVVSEAPTLRLSTLTFKLNRSLAGDTATCSASCPSQYYELSDIDFTPLSSPADGAITFSCGDGKLDVTSQDLGINGTYSYRAVGVFTDKITGYEVTGAPVTVRVSVYTAVPKAAVGARGSLNVLSREDSRLAYTLTSISGMSGDVSAYVLEGLSAEKFNSSLSFVKGKPVVTLTLKEGEDYATGERYYVRLGFKTTAVSEYAYTPTMTVRVTQPAIRVSASKTGFILFQSGRAQSFATTLSMTAPAFGELQSGSVSINPATNPLLTSALELTDAALSADGRSITPRFTVRNSSVLKANTNYTLVLNIVPADAATDARPTQVRLTLTIRP